MQSALALKCTVAVDFQWTFSWGLALSWVCVEGTLLIGSPPVPFPYSLLTVYQQEGACFLLVYERLMVGLPGFACPAMGVVSISRGTACQQLKLLNVSSTLPLFCEQLLTKDIHVHVFNLFNLLLHMYSLNPRCAKGQSDQPWTFCCLVLFLKWYVTQQGDKKIFQMESSGL